MRNALAHVSRGQHTVIAAAIRQAFDQPDRAHADQRACRDHKDGAGNEQPNHRE